MIILSLLEKTALDAKKQIKLAEKYAGYAQIDFVDGILYEDASTTFIDQTELAGIKTKIKLELHLMVKNPTDYVKTKIPNVYKICTQIEALDDCTEFIAKARDFGYVVGLSVGPDTNYDQLEQYLTNLDFVQFMDIYPGAQGRDLISEVIPKINAFHQKHPDIKIQVDGGVNEKNILQLLDAGVTDFVVGSTILKDSNPPQKYVELTNMTKTPVHKNGDRISTLTDHKIQKIAILGGAAWEENEQPYIDAFEVSKVLAEAGYELVNGGGPGVMRASTKGGHAGGGRVLAITYHPNKPKRHYEGVDDLNDFDDEIITLDYFDRTKVMLQTTQLHIVFKGSLGTLSEFGMTWISSWIHEPNNKPIVLYGEHWKDFLKFIDQFMLVSQAERNILHVCTTPEQVLEVVRKFDE